MIVWVQDERPDVNLATVAIALAGQVTVTNDPTRKPTRSRVGGITSSAID
jgi:hypothetical protein